MRVLHIVPSFYPAHGYGGPIASLYDLVRAQVAAGLQVRVLTSDADGASGRIPGVQGRWVKDFGAPTWYAPVLRSGGGGRGGEQARRFKALEDLAPGVAAQLPRWLGWAQVVHVTAVFSPTSLLGMLGAVARRRPLVVSPRGSLLPWALAQGAGRKRLFLRGLAPLLRRVAGWHATSQEEAQALSAVAGPKALIEVVENGVTLDAYPGDGPSPFARGDAGPVITLLGRVDPVKGLDLAVAALAVLRRRHPRAALVLAGPDRDGHGAVLRRQAAALGVADGLHFTGLLVGERKAALLAQSDQLWLCSRMESFGNVVLEALAAGTPVVAVRSTPWAWLEQAGLGAHCEASAEAVARAAEALLTRYQSAEARATFATHAQAEVAQRFAWPAIAARMTRLYEAVARASPAPWS